MTAGVSRHGPTDLAVAESFFNLLEREGIRRRTNKTRKEARQDVFDYTEFSYSLQRKYAGTKMFSPIGFRWS